MMEIRGITRVVGACIVLAMLAQTGCLTTNALTAGTGCSVIPTCASCTLTVNPNLSASADGQFGPYTCPYIRAGMLLDSGPAEVVVHVPQPSSPYSTALTVPFKPARATMCLYYLVGATAIRVCKEPFSVR